MPKYVQIRAIPAEGYKYRWGAGRPFTADPVTLEVVDGEIPTVKMMDPKHWDIGREVEERLANIRLRTEYFAKLPPHQIHVELLETMRDDRQIIIIEDAAAPPPPPKSEADQLRERVAVLEKQLSPKRA